MRCDDKLRRPTKKTELGSGVALLHVCCSWGEKLEDGGIEKKYDWVTCYAVTEREPTEPAASAPTGSRSTQLPFAVIVGKVNVDAQRNVADTVEDLGRLGSQSWSRLGQLDVLDSRACRLVVCGGGLETEQKTVERMGMAAITTMPCCKLKTAETVLRACRREWRMIPRGAAFEGAVQEGSLSVTSSWCWRDLQPPPLAMHVALLVSVAAVACVFCLACGLACKKEFFGRPG